MYPCELISKQRQPIRGHTANQQGDNLRAEQQAKVAIAPERVRCLGRRFHFSDWRINQKAI